MCPAAISRASVCSFHATGIDRNRKQLGKSIADHPQPQLRERLRQPFPDRSRLLEPLERARRTNPDKLEMVSTRLVPRDRIEPGSTHVGITCTRSTLAPARSAQSARKSFPATTVSAVQTVCAKRRDRQRLCGPRSVVRIAKHDRVVEVVDEVPRGAAQGTAIAIPAAACAAGSPRRIARPDEVESDEAASPDRTLR